jgi:hypothetical protein
MKTKLIIIGLAALLAAGCASVPMTTGSLDLKAKKFAPDPGKASIYVNRDGGIGTAVTIQTVLDGRIVGSLAPHTYQFLSVTSGEHVLSTGAGTQNVEQEKLNVEAGKNYFFKVGLAMGWVSPRVHLEQIDEQEGRNEVNNSKRAEATNF